MTVKKYVYLLAIISFMTGTLLGLLTMYTVKPVVEENNYTIIDEQDLDNMQLCTSFTIVKDGARLQTKEIGFLISNDYNENESIAKVFELLYANYDVSEKNNFKVYCGDLIIEDIKKEND